MGLTSRTSREELVLVFFGLGLIDISFSLFPLEQSKVFFIER